MTEPPGTPRATAEPLRQIAADVAVIVVFALALVTSRGFADVAIWFPTAVGIVGMAAGAGKLAVDLLALRRARTVPAPDLAAPGGEPAEGFQDDAAADGDRAPEQSDLVAPPLTRQGRRELLIWLGMLAVLLALIRLIGMVPAAAVWLPAVLWWRGRRSVVLAAGGAVAVVVLLVFLEAELNVRWPVPVLDIYGMLT